MKPARHLPHCPASAPRRTTRGLSMIELMVGLVIALVVSLVMFNVFIFAEGQRRTTASGSDAQQVGTYASYTLERYLRMGGAGMAQVSKLWGCRLDIASPTGTVRAPLPTLDAPFGNLGLENLRAVPVLIVNASNDEADKEDAQSSKSDALVVMAGVHRSINTFLQMTSPAVDNQVPVLNSIGLQANDLLLAVDQAAAAPNADWCRLVQNIRNPGTDATSIDYRQSTLNGGRTLELGGDDYMPSLTTSRGAYSGSTLLANLGGQPMFSIFALQPSGSADLQVYDVLSGTTQSLADGVVDLQAIYGISTGPTTLPVTSWVAPTGTWSASTLMNGSAASAVNLARIRAIRFAITTRSALKERTAVGPEALSVFTDLEDLAVTRTLTDEQRRYRYRQFDQIVPLRNLLLS